MTHRICDERLMIVRNIIHELIDVAFKVITDQSIGMVASREFCGKLNDLKNVMEKAAKVIS